MLVDAHIHLTDDELLEISNEILLMLENMDIKAVSVSMDLETSIANIRLADRSRNVLPFIGIHPWCYNEDLDKFIQFAEDNIDKVYGIGEIGLDKKYVKDDKEYGKQKKVFNAMLELAEKHSKPISVHSRASLDDVLAVLSCYNIKGVLLHWFSGSKKQLRKANGNGYYVSFGPALLYASDKPSLLLNADKDLVLIETDAPVRYPRCFEGKMALPSFLVSVAYALANILSLDYADALDMLYNNAFKYLGIDTIK